MTIYRKVKVSDRLPKNNGKYICLEKDGRIITPFFLPLQNKFTGYNPPEYWLEEVELPTLTVIRNEASKEEEVAGYFEELAFEKGANYILNIIKGKE